jgi:hypothetical protein
MTRQPHLASVALKRKPAAMGMKAPRAPSIVDGFCRLPWLEYAVGSVAPVAYHLALVAAREPLVAIHEDAQNDNRHATTRDGPAAVWPVGKWPMCDGPAPLFRGGPSDSPVQ